MEKYQDCPQCDKPIFLCEWIGVEFDESNFWYNESKTTTKQTCDNCDWKGEEKTSTSRTWLWQQFWVWLKNKKDDVKYWCERKLYGYDRTAKWSLNSYLVRNNYKAIRKGLDSIRLHCIKDGAVPNEDLSKEEWLEILDKIEFAFWFYDLESRGRETYEEIYYDFDGEPDCEKIMEDEKRAQEGFELFGKYFQYLAS